MNQSQLLNVLSNMYPSAMFIRDYTIAVDDSGNATVATWRGALGTQPTADRLAAELTTLQLQQAQDAQIAVLQAAYSANGYAPVSYMGASFPSDPNTLLLLSCTLVQGSTPQGLPSGFAWYDATGTGVAMTLTQLQGLGNAIFAQVYAAYVKLQGLIAQVESASTVAGMQAVVWS